MQKIGSELRRHRHLFGACARASHATQRNALQRRFLRDGHDLRHLRRMKRLNTVRRNALISCLQEMAPASLMVQATAGMNVAALLPKAASDVNIASRALQPGLAPSALSPWYMESSPRRGCCLALLTSMNGGCELIAVG